MRIRNRILLIGLVVTAAIAVAPVAWGTTLLAQADTTKGKGKGDDKKDPPLLTAEDSAQAEARRVEKAAEAARKAAARPLFADAVPLEFTLVANYGALARDRDTLSTKRFAGTVIVKDTAGADRTIPVQLRTRGHFRLLARNCRFVPLRVVFPDSGLKGTPFAGQDGIKLGTHCQNNDDRYDTYTRKEYLAYRLFNVITDRSFRARLATATYVDSASNKPVATRVAMFIESEDDISARIGAKIRELRGAMFDDVEKHQLLLAMLFQYAIGNTDISLYALHNMRIAAGGDGTMIPLIYDFDFSGMVNTHYATPDPRMGIRTVRERKYRGPCATVEEYQAAAQQFLLKKNEFMAEIAAVPGLSSRDQKDVAEYLKEFYDVLEDPRRFKREIMDACERRPGM